MPGSFVYFIPLHQIVYCLFSNFNVLYKKTEVFTELDNTHYSRYTRMHIYIRMYKYTYTQKCKYRTHPINTKYEGPSLYYVLSCYKNYPVSMFRQKKGSKQFHQMSITETFKEYFRIIEYEVCYTSLIYYNVPQIYEVFNALYKQMD